MNKAEIKRTQERVGTTPDGFWGSASTRAAQRHLQALMPDRSGMPTQKQVQSDRSIYGPHGDPDGGYGPPSETINLPFALHLYGDANVPVRALRVHPEAVDLLDVFNLLADAYPDEASRKAAGILDYYGLYNPRFIRGGGVWSMHAYRIAIDLDASRNGNRSHWPVAASMPIEVMECFAKVGWLSAGAMWSRDAMHFQRTR